MKRILKILSYVEFTNDSHAPSQTCTCMKIRLSGMPQDSINGHAEVEYTDRGNNANYESCLTPFKGEDRVTEDDLHMIYLAVDENNDRIYAGSMFMLDYETEEVIPITFTKVLES